MTGTTASPIRPTPSERLRAAALMGGGVTFDQVFADDLLAEIAALKRERAKAVALARTVARAPAESPHRAAIRADDDRRYVRARILLKRAAAFHAAACWVLAFALLFFFVAIMAMIGGRP